MIQTIKISSNPDALVPGARTVTIPPDLLETWAMRLAVGNNGGTWDTHYKDEQKGFWLAMAAEFITDCTLNAEIDTPAHQALHALCKPSSIATASRAPSRLSRIVSTRMRPS